jgi:hypothetical protein
MQPGNSYTRGIFTYSYPHTVENGARERITFVQRLQDPAGDRLEFENHLKLGSGPPINIHNHHPSHARRCGFFVLFSETNDNSVTILLTHGTARVLLGGDAKAREEYMLSGSYTRP